MKFSQFTLCSVAWLILIGKCLDYDGGGGHVNASFNLVTDLVSHLSLLSVVCPWYSGFLGYLSHVLQNSELRITNCSSVADWRLAYGL